MDRKEYQRQYRLKHREHHREQARQSKIRRKNPCPICGNLKGHKARFCRPCYYKSRIGKRSKNWKGGRCKHGAGYIIIHMPEHPRANKQGYVLEHIAVWEKYHNRPLPAHWHIHHLNGIKDDNRIVNLQALSSHKHSLILAAKAKRIQELEGLLNHQSHLL